jgi:rubrerythrin
MVSMPSERKLSANSSFENRSQCELGPGRLGESLKSDALLRDAVRLTNHPSNVNDNRDLAEMTREPRFFFVCGRCDMLVREEDERCQFCGAVFVPNEYEEPVEATPENVQEESGIRPMPPLDGEVPAPPKPEVQTKVAHKVDVLEMLEDEHANLEIERYSGGASRAHSYASILLKNTEKIIQEAADFGADTEKANKYLIFARRAFREGRISQAISLAEKARKVLIPNVTLLIRGQISCMREAMIEMKHRGKPLTPMIIEMKTIQKALKDSRIDKAIKQTRSLMRETRKAQMELLEDLGGHPLSFGQPDPDSGVSEGI